MASEQSEQIDNNTPGNNWIPMDDGTQLFFRRWKIPAAKAVLHIVHGMAEHSFRYDRLARRLGEEGIEVWAADQRGHGETASCKENKAGSGGLLGHCADEDGFIRVSADIDILNRTIYKEHPNIPLFLLGHSWGSFIVQNYIENFEGKDSGNGEKPVFLAGCILSGTRGPDGIKISLGKFVMDFLACFMNERKGSRIAKALADGPNNKPFKPNRTEFDWLCRDEKEVDRYIIDPLCGFLCSLGFYRDMARALNQIHKSEEMGKIRKDLPVYILSGSADPVGDMGASHAALVVAYRHLGIIDLETVLYPGARHETLNETNREEVTGSLISWLLRHCP
jgi:alpha-beta hydrolase superfamily lysophospholipase